MAAYRRVYDSHHLKADLKTSISSGTLRLVNEYELPFLLVLDLPILDGMWKVGLSECERAICRQQVVKITWLQQNLPVLNWPLQR